MDDKFLRYTLIHTRDWKDWKFQVEGYALKSIAFWQKESHLVTKQSQAGLSV
jgi:hypothetical protein